MFAFLSTPADAATSHLCSLNNNQLCGVRFRARGTYTAEGITKLCEGLKGSSVTSLRCAIVSVLAIASVPTDTPHHPRSILLLTVSSVITSVPREEPRSLRASKEIRRCKCSSTSPGTRTDPQVFTFCVNAH